MGLEQPDDAHGDALQGPAAHGAAERRDTRDTSPGNVPRILAVEESRRDSDPNGKGIDLYDSRAQRTPFIGEE